MAKGDQTKYLAKVLEAVEKTSQRSGAKYWTTKIMCWKEDGAEPEGGPMELDASIPPWFGWLFPPMQTAAGTETGLLLTVDEGDEKKDGGAFFNVVAIDGVEKPVDWKDDRPAATKGGEAGGKASQPSPVQTRIAVISAVNKIGEIGWLKDEAAWNAWYKKIDGLVFNGKMTNASDAAKPRT